MCRQLWQPKNKFPFVHFYNVLHCLVRPYVKCSFSGGWKQKKILKLSAEKVVAVAYGRWSRFTRGSSMALTEDIFGVLGRWSPAAGARTWKFDCIITLSLCLLSRNIADWFYTVGWLQRRLSVTFTITGRRGNLFYSCLQNIETVC